MGQIYNLYRRAVHQASSELNRQNVENSGFKLKGRLPMHFVKQMSSDI